MSDIPDHGSGERGVFKLERPEKERPARNLSILAKEAERGIWWRNPRTKLLERFKQAKLKRLHAVRQDTIAPIESPLTPAHQKRFVTDSRSQYERHAAEHGQRVLSKEELKQEWAKQEAERIKAREFNPREHVEHWDAAEQDIKYGKVQLTELEKERCRVEQRYLKARAKGSRSDLYEERLTQDKQTVEYKTS